MVQVILDRITCTKPASGIGFVTAYCHETINQHVRVFTFEYVVAEDVLWEVLEAVAEDAGYQVAGLY